MSFRGSRFKKGTHVKIVKYYHLDPDSFNEKYPQLIGSKGIISRSIGYGKYELDWTEIDKHPKIIFKAEQLKRIKKSDHGNINFKEEECK